MCPGLNGGKRIRCVNQGNRSSKAADHLNSLPGVGEPTVYVVKEYIADDHQSIIDQIAAGGWLHACWLVNESHQINVAERAGVSSGVAAHEDNRPYRFAVITAGQGLKVYLK
jgi:hypothetical protein